MDQSAHQPYKPSASSATILVAACTPNMHVTCGAPALPGSGC
jgi:hypothetical protein